MIQQGLCLITSSYCCRHEQSIESDYEAGTIEIKKSYRSKQRRRMLCDVQSTAQDNRNDGQLTDEEAAHERSKMKVKREDVPVEPLFRWPVPTIARYGRSSLYASER